MSVWKVDLSKLGLNKIEVYFGGHTLELLHGQYSDMLGLIEDYPHLFVDKDGNNYNPTVLKSIDDTDVLEQMDNIKTMILGYKDNVEDIHPTSLSEFTKALQLIETLENGPHKSWLDYVNQGSNLKNAMYDIATEGYKNYPEDEQESVRELASNVYIESSKITQVMLFDQRKYDYIMEYVDTVKQTMDNLQDGSLPIYHTPEPTEITVTSNPDGTLTVAGDTGDVTEGKVRITWPDGTITTEDF